MRDLETVAGKLQFLVVPAWIEEALGGINHGQEQKMLDVSLLTSILSVQDVQKYTQLNSDAPALLFAAGMENSFIAKFIGSNGVADIKGMPKSSSLYDLVARDSKTSAITLFNYFNDSDKIAVGEGRYYYEIIPFCDTVMGLHIRLADNEEEAKIAQEDALRRTAAILRRYVSLKELALSGFLGAYLDSIRH